MAQFEILNLRMLYVKDEQEKNKIIQAMNEIVLTIMNPPIVFLFKDKDGEHVVDIRDYLNRLKAVQTENEKPKLVLV